MMNKWYLLVCLCVVAPATIFGMQNAQHQTLVLRGQHGAAGRWTVPNGPLWGAIIAHMAHAHVPPTVTKEKYYKNAPGKPHRIKKTHQPYCNKKRFFSQHHK